MEDGKEGNHLWCKRLTSSKRRTDLGREKTELRRLWEESISYSSDGSGEEVTSMRNVSEHLSKNWIRG